MLAYKVVFCAVVAAIFVFSVWLNFALHQERKELETALEAAQDYCDALKADISKQADVLAEREIKINSLTADRNRLNRKLREAAEHEQEVKLWIDTAVPDSVSRLLKDGASSADTSATADPVQ